MIYDIRHVTTYTYDAPVAYSLCALRLSPTSRTGQRVIDVQIDIDPPAAKRVQHTCFFGNDFEIVHIEAEHRELTVSARARIAVARPVPPAITPDWEEVRQEAFSVNDLGPEIAGPFHLRQPHRHAGRACRRLCAAKFSAGPADSRRRRRPHGADLGRFRL